MQVEFVAPGGVDQPGAIAIVLFEGDVSSAATLDAATGGLVSRAAQTGRFKAARFST